MISILSARYMRQIPSARGPVDVVKVDVRVDTRDTGAWDGTRSLMVHVDAGDRCTIPGSAFAMAFGDDLYTAGVHDVAVATAWAFDPRGNATIPDPVNDPSFAYLEVPAPLPVRLGV